MILRDSVKLKRFPLKQIRPLVIVQRRGEEKRRDCLWLGICVNRYDKDEEVI